ncbi:MAG TPA: histidine kinase [Nocardioidaceae bacterium]|nr:histidine kinase [Nocardioidaceae bacterium]
MNARVLSDRLRSLFREPPTPVAPPPITTWGRIWRTGAAVVIGLAVWIDVARHQLDQAPALFWVDLTLGLTALVLLQYWRRRPFAVAMTITIMGCLSAFSAGAFTVATASLATRRRWNELLPYVVVSIASSLVFYQVEPIQDSFFANLISSVLVVGVLVAFGMYVGARRELLATLKDRAERAEREQAMRVGQARANERGRIAREMHDVLAHRISLVAMHAGAMTYRSDLSADEMRRTAGIIQDNAHQALSDLREVLGMLRDDRSTPTPERPQPTLRDVPDLVEEAQAVGMNVRLTNEVDDLEAAPEIAGRSAYRIIQESLTNARKHAPDTAVHVQLSGRAGTGLTVEVRNPLRVGVPDGREAAVPGSGLGLIGLAERAEISGGHLEHGRTASREFFVRAELPWPEPVAAGGE